MITSLSDIASCSSCSKTTFLNGDSKIHMSAVWTFTARKSTRLYGDPCCLINWNKQDRMHVNLHRVGTRFNISAMVDHWAERFMSFSIIQDRLTPTWPTSVSDLKYNRTPLQLHFLLSIGCSLFLYRLCLSCLESQISRISDWGRDYSKRF